MSKGTYAGVHFSEGTKDAIEEYLKTNDVPNLVPRDKLHTTVLYSRKHLPDFKAEGEIHPRIIGVPEKFEIWKSQGGKNCLVLVYKCPTLVRRHEYLMDEHKATYDYPEYKTHVTFSYDVGGKPIQSFPKFTPLLLIVEEYQEVLNLDWADGTKTNNEERKKQRKEMKND